MDIFRQKWYGYVHVIVCAMVLLLGTKTTGFSQENDMSKMLTIGIGQMHVDGGNPDLNLRNAVSFIQEAAEKSCDIIVLPECLDFGWTHSAALTGAKAIPGPYSDVLVQAARTHRIHVIAGLTERAGDKIHNTAILISPEGELLGKHHKINILDIAQHIYTPGSSCAVINTAIGAIGMNICADNSPSTNQLGHALGFMGADIILSPCSWAVPPDFNNEETPYGDIWKESYTEIANKHQIPVIGVSNTGLVKDGKWRDWWCIGASLVVSRDGQIKQQFPYTRKGSSLYVIDVEIGAK